MDILFFLTERTSFIRNFFDEAGASFRETMRKIEAGEAPFFPGEVVDEGPPHFEVWREAEAGLAVVGQTCVSHLSHALQLYFSTWESELRIKIDDSNRKKYFKKGFVSGYRTVFALSIGVPWEGCPIDMGNLQQIVLARNDIQHSYRISTMKVQYHPKTIKRFKTPLFSNKLERKMAKDAEPLGQMFAPFISVSRENLEIAIGEVNEIAIWLEPYMIVARQSR